MRLFKPHNHSFVNLLPIDRDAEVFGPILAATRQQQQALSKPFHSIVYLANLSNSPPSLLSETNAKKKK